MTGEEQQLLEQYLTYLGILGEEGTHPSFEAWYQEVRYARGDSAPNILQEASELRFKEILDEPRRQRPGRAADDRLCRACADLRLRGNC